MHCNRKKKKILFFVDFDGTITTADTLSKIAHQNVEKNRKREEEEEVATNNNNNNGPVLTTSPSLTSATLLQTWKSIERDYMARYEKIMSDWFSSNQKLCQQQQQPSEVPMCDSAQQKVPTAIPTHRKKEVVSRAERFLAILNDLEEFGIHRTINSCVLKGLTQKELFALGGSTQIEKQPHAVSVLRSLIASDTVEVHIVSANWSRDLVCGCIHEVICCRDGMANSSSSSHHKHRCICEEITRSTTGNHDYNSCMAIKVYCNDLEFAPEQQQRQQHHTTTITTTGNIIRRVVFAAHKRDYMNAILDAEIQRQIKNNNNSSSSSSSIISDDSDLVDTIASVYVGDSIHDLLGMLHADIGLIFGSSRTLLTVLDIIGVHVLPLADHILDLKKEQQQQPQQQTTLYRTSSWLEIQALFSLLLAEENKDKSKSSV